MQKLHFHWVREESKTAIAVVGDDDNVAFVSNFATLLLNPSTVIIKQKIKNEHFCRFWPEHCHPLERVKLVVKLQSKCHASAIHNCPPMSLSDSHSDWATQCHNLLTECWNVKSEIIKNLTTFQSFSNAASFFICSLFFTIWFCSWCFTCTIPLLTICWLMFQLIA